ncbi:putative G-patch domain, R3H domain, R3H domain superfamily protein [Helianthus debilis subsp. tardiflorus]
MAGTGKNKQKSGKSINRKPIKQSLFVEGGLLSDWSPVTDSPPSKGKSNNNGKNSGSNSKNKSKASSSRMIEEKRKMNAVGYSYPQVDLLPDEVDDEHKTLDESNTIVLVDAKVVAYVDETKVEESETVKYSTEYDANSEVDDTFHRGLGFHDKEEDPCVNEKKEGPISASSSSEEIETDPLSSPEKNSGFLSIGGMKLYTQDISDVEDDDEDKESVESSESEDSSDSSDNDTSSDTDDEIAKDYIEGIRDDDDVINDTLVKFGGIALQEASREYGMKKPRSRVKSQSQPKSIKFRADKDDWSAIDDFMLVKDPRIAYAQKKKKKHEKRRLPGEKKKQRQDTIALKRKERMIRRGVDLEEINSKLEQMVQNEGDIMSFQLMHSRDCSQVQRLASIYCLRSCSQGSGKRRFVTVTRSEHTGMPSSNDRIRLEKLIGDANTAVNNTPPAKMAANSSKKASKGTTGLSPLDSRLTKAKTYGESSGKQRREKDKTVVTYAKQPVSFISCGNMEPEPNVTTLPTTSPVDEPKPRDQTASSSSYGAFENHTTGFGSRMMAKMGYVDGNGLGKDGTGIAEPIEVIQRPKSLGLGAEPEAPEDTTPPPLRVKGQSSRSSSESRGRSGSGNARVGSFERHTKGFGSKMMAKMGYVEGSGLGRESQGIVDPLVATRLPKSRGLGANG